MISQKVITMRIFQTPRPWSFVSLGIILILLMKTGAVRIVRSCLQVFTPEWLVSSIDETLLPINVSLRDDMPVITVICKNEEMYNLDYYLHLSNFENRYRVLLGGADGVGAPSPVPIVSEISRVDVKNLGHMTEQVLEMAGYQHEENGPVPGDGSMCANNWMTSSSRSRYRPTKRIEQLKIRSTPYQGGLPFNLENPIIGTSHVVGEDIRVCIIDSMKPGKKALWVY